ncbi:MAG: LysR family substrate-binding domain-containing protein, partial [Verrucomicrobiota bacterium]
NAVTLTDAGELFYEEARDLLARADQAIQRVRGECRTELLRVGYGPSLTSGIMPQALEKFQAATPRVRIELSDLTPREMIAAVKEGQLDLVITPAGFENVFPGFQWLELRRMAPVLVVPVKHPFAKLKKIAPARVREQPLIALGRENFPDYSSWMRSIFKPFEVVPRFIAQVNDGVMPLFAALEAHNAGAVLADGVACLMPRALVAIPFSPALAPIVVKIGLPAVRPNPHAGTFARLLREAVGK